MQPTDEHTFYMWLLIVGAVCVAVLIGVTVDRFLLNRRIKRMEAFSHKLETSTPYRRQR